MFYILIIPYVIFYTEHYNTNLIIYSVYIVFNSCIIYNEWLCHNLLKYSRYCLAFFQVFTIIKNTGTNTFEYKSCIACDFFIKCFRCEMSESFFLCTSNQLPSII